MKCGRVPILALFGLAFLALAPSFPAQEATAAPDFDVEAFYAHAEIAEWLMRYDAVAWHTTDLVLAEPRDVLERLGGEWFCLERDGRWYAVYGRYDAEAERYEIVRQYASGPDGYAASDDELPPEEIEPRARALHAAAALLPDWAQTEGTTLNRYVRRLPNGRLEVRFLPAWQRDGTLAYGEEYRFVLDADGRAILERSKPESALKRVKVDPGETVMLPNEGADVPSVGQIFTILMLEGHVRLGAIRSRSYTSVLLDVPSRSRAVWVHVENSQSLDEGIAAVRRLESERAASGGDDSASEMSEEDSP